MGMTTTLETALHMMDADVQLTPRSLLRALHQAEEMAKLGYPLREGSHAKVVNDTLLYRRPAPDAAERYSGENARTTNVPGTPRDPRDMRFHDGWLDAIVEHQGAFLLNNGGGSENAREGLRYALDKAGLTLVPR